MLKKLLFISLGLLPILFFLPGISAQDMGVLASVTPEGYLYGEPETCLACGHQSVGWRGNTHLENATGVAGAVDTHGLPTSDVEVEITGIGWISSSHAKSMDKFAASNSYCAWCHAPGQKRVTNDPFEEKQIRKDRQGMSCIGCHTTHTLAGEFGTRYTNYKPGAPTDEAASYIPRHIEDGRQANRQCRECHGGFHGFAENILGVLHEEMVDDGDLRCVDCHMAVITKGGTSFGTPERYHNMKVVENGSDSCARCHDFTNREVRAYVKLIYQGHPRANHNMPDF